MMRNFYLVILLLPIQSYGQKMISASIGYGTYRMNDMTNFQQELAPIFPIEGKTTLAFPGYWFYDISYKQIISDKFLIGGGAGYGSTAGRISYSDYSGSINYDQLLTFYSFPLHFGQRIKLPNEKIILTADLQPGLTHTNLTLLFQEQIGSLSQNESYKFTSLNLYIQPSLGFVYKLNRIGLNAQLGYQLDIGPGKLKYSEDVFLRDSDENPVVANWSGLRASVGVVYLISR